MSSNPHKAHSRVAEGGEAVVAAAGGRPVRAKLNGLLLLVVAVAAHNRRLFQKCLIWLN